MTAFTQIFKRQPKQEVWVLALIFCLHLVMFVFRVGGFYEVLAVTLELRIIKQQDCLSFEWLLVGEFLRKNDVIKDNGRNY